MAEMIHFIRQMEAYCQLEVIECSWKILVDFVQKKEGDLDALIHAHRQFLDRMVKKILLLTSKSGREESILSQVREVFAIVLQFREATVRSPTIDAVRLLTDLVGRLLQLLPLGVCSQRRGQG